MATKPKPTRRKKKYRLKYKVRWKVMIPFLILILLVIYLIVTLLNVLFAVDRNQITICTYNKEETLEKMNSHYEDSFTISDFFYYGESLSLYANDYDPLQQDALQNATLQLKNLCDGSTRDITMGDYADQKIFLPDVEPGYYEVYLLRGNSKQRLVYDEVLQENSFSTIARNSKVKTVELISDPAVLNNEDAVLDKNYLFMKVEEEKPSKEVIDVFIDPYGNNTDLKDEVDKGQVYHNMSENKEIMKAAQLLKAELEEAGLRVQISRDSSDTVTTLFGENGRLINAYNAHAKYYIKLGMNGSPLDYARGTEIIYSAYASDTLAKTVLQNLVSKTELKGSTMRYPDEENPGLIRSLPVEGMDGRLVYDDYLYVREAGGKATLAGLKDEKSAANSFAKGNPYGMQGLELDYIYLSSSDDMNYWKESRDVIIEETANGLLQAWKIETEE